MRRRAFLGIGLTLLLCAALAATGAVALRAKQKGAPTPGRTLIGQPAPDFVIHDIGGFNPRLDTLAGDVILLYFFSARCSPCGLNAPTLNFWQQQLRSQGLSILGIDEGDPAATTRAYTNQSLRFHVAYDPSGLVRRLLDANHQLPDSILIDRHGIIRGEQMGRLNSRFRGILTKLLEQADPAMVAPTATPVSRSREGTIEFGRDAFADGADVRLGHPTTTFRFPSPIAWIAYLRPTAGYRIEQQLLQLRSRGFFLVHREILPQSTSTAVSPWVVSSDEWRAYRLSRPGLYQVRYLEGNRRLAEGAFTLLPFSTSRPAQHHHHKVRQSTGKSQGHP